MEPTAPKLHPLLTIAAISVTAVSLAGIGVLTGVIPAPRSLSTVQAPAAATSPAAPQATPQLAQAAGAPSASTDVAPTAPPPNKQRLAHRAIKAMAEKKAPAGEHTAPATPPMAAATLPPPPGAPAPAICQDCGVVEGVHEVVTPGKGTGIGVVAGGLAGAVIGNQFGSGGARDVARIGGAVAGGYLGNEVEKSARKTTHYDISVRMDNGSMRTVTADVQPAWRAGDRVKISNGVLVANP